MISLGRNIPALRVQRQLDLLSGRIGELYERLSSGSRLNNARDDPASLAIVSSLKLQQRLARMAIHNTNDGVSALSIADAALSSIGTILTRMAELAQQAANGTCSPIQRRALQAEFDTLGSEIERIAQSTSFNGLGLINQESTISLQVGFNGGHLSEIYIPRVDATLSGLGLAKESGLAFFLVGSTIDEAQTNARLALEGLQEAAESLVMKHGQLGAAQSRLGATIESLAASELVLAESESRLRDIDIASEAAELTRLLILQNIGTAVLAMALNEPQLALILLL